MSRLAPSGYVAGPEAHWYPGKVRPPERCEPGRHAATGHVHGIARPGRRAVVAEPHPRLRAAIEHALLGEGYRVVDGEHFDHPEEPVILFAGAWDGLHVFEARDVTGALADLCENPGLPRGEGSFALGIHAFVPRPFGAADVLRVARAVGDFDPRRKTPEP